MDLHTIAIVARSVRYFSYESFYLRYCFPVSTSIYNTTTYCNLISFSPNFNFINYVMCIECVEVLHFTKVLHKMQKFGMLIQIGAASYNNCFLINHTFHTLQIEVSFDNSIEYQMKYSILISISSIFTTTLISSWIS